MNKLILPPPGHLIAALFLALFFPGYANSAVNEAVKKSDTATKCVQLSSPSLYMFTPGCQETIKRAGQESHMRYNKNGLRDKDFSKNPRPGWIRVLFLGSSAMAGPGISEEETLPKRLESLLRRKFKKIEVINAGVEGYSAIQIAAQVPYWIADYNPTHVLLFLDIGQSANFDPINSVFAKWDAEENVTLAYEIFPFFRSIAQLLNWDLNSYSVIRRLHTIQSIGNRTRRSISCKLQYSSENDETECMLRTTLRSLKSIKKHADAAGAKFLYLAQANSFTNDLKISPGEDLQVAQFFDRLTPAHNFPAPQVRVFVEATGVPVHYLRLHTTIDDYLPGDYHLSAKGTLRYAKHVEPTVASFLGK